MARPEKQGLDYFPLDVDIDMDEKVEVVEAKHGPVGFAALIKILMRIYRNGYCYPWTEKEQWLLARRMGLGIEKVQEIIGDAARWGFFDQDILQEHGVLTSKGIQKRYLNAASRRKRVEIRREYLLICEPCLSDYKNLVVVDENGELAPQGAQNPKKKKGRKKDRDLKKPPDKEPEGEKGPRGEGQKNNREGPGAADTTAALEHYKTKFRKAFNTEPEISYGKDTKILKDLVQKHGLGKVKRIIDHFLADNEKFVQENGYSLGTMKTKANKYLIEVNKQPVMYGSDWIEKKNREELERLQRENQKEDGDQ